MISKIFHILFFCFMFVTLTLGCQSTIGGTCVGGTMINRDLTYVNRIETCTNDLNKDWCVVVYKETIDQADFHCFNQYNTIPVFGGKVCGNGPFDIQSGGCDRLRAPDGSACLVCCCRGNLCNNQFTFSKELDQLYAFRNEASKNNIFLSIFHLFIFYFLLFFMN